MSIPRFSAEATSEGDSTRSCTATNNDGTASLEVVVRVAVVAASLAVTAVVARTPGAGEDTIILARIDPGKGVALFLERASRLGDKLGPILFQLPPTYQADLDTLRRFLGELPAGHRWVIEFRHHTPGNLRAMVQAKLKNLRNGSTIEHRFRAADSIEKADPDLT